MKVMDRVIEVMRVKKEKNKREEGILRKEEGSKERRKIRERKDRIYRKDRKDRKKVFIQFFI